MDKSTIITSLSAYVSTLGIDLSEGYDAENLVMAFTHKSYAADFNEKIADNERLEFLGDAVLGLCISQYLFQDFPDLSESEMTLYKIFLVKESTLASIGYSIGLHEYILLGNGEEKQGGRDKDSVVSDALESLIGYIFADHGADQAWWFIEEYIYSLIRDLDQLPGKSAKSILQERVQKKYKKIPVYNDQVAKVNENGEPELYSSTVTIEGVEQGCGTGPSKKKAQESAAIEAIKKLRIE